MFDHFHAVVRTICSKLRRGADPPPRTWSAVARTASKCGTAIRSPTNARHANASARASSPSSPRYAPGAALTPWR